MLDNRLGVLYFILFFFKKILKSFFLVKDISEEEKKFHINKYEKFFLDLKSKDKKKESILLICLDSFQIYFFYIWLTIYKLTLKKKYKLKIVTSKKNKLILFLIKNYKIEYFLAEDILKKRRNIKSIVSKRIRKLSTFNDFYNFRYETFDVGMMIISNFCRIHKVGFVNYASPVQKKILKKSIENFISEYEFIKKENFFNDVRVMFAFEKNLFPDLHFFLYSIKNKLKFFYWSGSNLDEKSFIIKKYSKENIYSHHSSVSKNLWNKIKNYKGNKFIKNNVKIFNKRFSGKFAPFLPNLMECTKDINSKIKLLNNKPNCLIFSHIMHDTLYFFGKEYYDSYSHWLIETTKVACLNKKVNWYIKFHPSNLYRGEFNKGKSKEEDIIRQNIKKIPNHVKFIYPDTKINPLRWMKFADIGITVRGTAGLEMAVLNKPVITCGRNRYENKGFTIDPNNKLEYENLLLKLPKLDKVLDKKSYSKANIFYNYVFEQKVFSCDFMETKINSKKFNWNEIKFNIRKELMNKKNIRKIKEYLNNSKSSDFIK